MKSQPEEVLLYAVGDVIPNIREDPGSLFRHVAGLLRAGDIAFCQLESVLSERGSPLPYIGLGSRARPETARAIKEAGFKVVSFASNHCMDFGVEAFLDTLEELRRQGLLVVGAGRNIEEARQPAIVECKGTRFAFLAYNSILPPGSWADARKPGCAPLRAWTLYEQVEYFQPGTPCRIHTFPHREDLEALVQDVKKARSEADVVVLSMHWGVHFVPAVIAEYQREVAHIAIDSGVDLILGTHPHILKGIEVYQGKVIFYSLCNFAAELAATEELLQSKMHHWVASLNPTWQPDPDYPTYYMPPDSRKTIIVKCMIADKKIKRVSYLPTYINRQSEPEVLQSGDMRFKEVVEYIQRITEDQGLPASFAVQGDEVVIHQAVKGGCS